ncbi:RNI-like protein, partial [Imleria badia]
VESFYRECCASREEEPDPPVSASFKRASATKPRSVDLSGVQLTPTAAAILSDVFNIEWGLRKLTLRECDLDESKLKPILHALLIPGTLEYLSVASNRRLKSPAFKLIGAYASQAKSLQFLDLSSTVLDKKAVDYIVVCLTTAPEPGLVSLRLDDCALRPNALEALARVVRTSSLRNISLRHNKITGTGGGAVALALMIRDYPDIVTGPTTGTPAITPSDVYWTHTPPPGYASVLGPQPTYAPYIPGRFTPYMEQIAS